MTSELAPLVHWSLRQKLNRVGSVQFSYIALYAPLIGLIGRWRNSLLSNSCSLQQQPMLVANGNSARSRLYLLKLVM